MNKRILLLQFRDDASQYHEVECFVGKSGLSRDHFKVINTITDNFDDNPDQILDGIDVVILGGSAQYDLSKNPKPALRAIKKTEKIFDYLLSNDFPTLGVCFGYQLIALKLGSLVRGEESMAETGTVEMIITDRGRNDRLFKLLELDKFYVQMGHKDSVIGLPNKCELLGYTNKNQVSAFRYKNNIYGVQCHPELSSEDIRYRLTTYPEYTRGANVDEIMKDIEETPHAASLIRLFIETIGSYGSISGRS